MSAKAQHSRHVSTFRSPMIRAAAAMCVFALAAASSVDAQSRIGESGVLSALGSVEGDLSASAGGMSSERAQRWSEYLDLQALNQALGTDEFADTAKRVDDRVEAVLVTPSATRMERATADIRRFLDGGDPGIAVDSVDALRNHLQQLGRRGSGWNDLLALNEVDALLKQNAEGILDDDARGKLTQSVSFLEDETQRIKAGFDGGRRRLRRALSYWQSRQDHPITDGLALDALAAIDRYRPMDDQNLSNARVRLRNSINQLNNFLTQGTPENAENWKKFLRLSTVQEQLDAEQPRLRELVRSLRRFESGNEGLMLPEFRSTGKDLRSFVERVQLFDQSTSRLTNAKRDLQSAMEGLEGFLETASQDRADNWRRFLRWESLDELLGEDSRDIRRFNRVFSRLNAEEEGLEMAPFRRVKQQLGKYMELLIASRSGVTADDRVAAQLERLARDLQAHANHPSAITAAALDKDLQWLRSAGQFPELANRVSSRFQLPNLRFRIGSQLVARALSDTQTQCDPVAMWFCGSWVTGTTRAKVGYVGQLVPSQNNAVIDLAVGGMAVTRGVGRQRRVRAYNTAYTRLAATKRLVFDGFSVTTLPAVAQASTCQSLDRICVDRLCGRRIIKFFARRQAKKIEPCAIQFANCQGREKLQQQLDEEASTMLEKTNRQLADLRQQLTDQGLFPDSLNVQSTPQSILLSGTLSSGGSFTSPSMPPELDSSSDVVVQLHESVVNNLIAKQMAGLKIDSDGMEEQLKELNLELPQAEGEDEDPWSMQFDKVAPVSVGFRDGKLSLTVRGSNFTRADQKIDNTIDITAIYEFVWSVDNGLALRRVGEVGIDFVGVDGRLSTRQIAYKTFLARQVGRLFQPRLTMDDIPAGDIKDQLESLPPKSVYARGGWITLGVDISDAMIKEAMGA